MGKEGPNPLGQRIFDMMRGEGEKFQLRTIDVACQRLEKIAHGMVAKVAGDKADTQPGSIRAGVPAREWRTRHPAGQASVFPGCAQTFQIRITGGVGKREQQIAGAGQPTGAQAQCLAIARLGVGQAPHLAKGVAEVVVNLGRQRAQPQGLAVTGLGLREQTLILQDQSEVQMRLKPVGIDLQGLLKAGLGILDATHFPQGDAQVDHGLDISGVDPEGLEKFSLRFGQAPLLLQDQSKVAQGVNAVGLQLDRPPQAGLRLGQLTVQSLNDAQVVVGIMHPGIAKNRLLVAGAGRRQQADLMLDAAQFQPFGSAAFLALQRVAHAGLCQHQLAKRLVGQAQVGMGLGVLGEQLHGFLNRRESARMFSLHVQAGRQRFPAEPAFRKPIHQFTGKYLALGKALLVEQLAYGLDVLIRWLCLYGHGRSWKDATQGNVRLLPTIVSSPVCQVSSLLPVMRKFSCDCERPCRDRHHPHVHPTSQSAGGHQPVSRGQFQEVGLQ